VEAKELFVKSLQSQAFSLLTQFIGYTGITVVGNRSVEISVRQVIVEAIIETGYHIRLRSLRDWKRVMFNQREYHTQRLCSI
jgi:hypothetical protein